MKTTDINAGEIPVQERYDIFYTYTYVHSYVVSSLLNVTTELHIRRIFMCIYRYIQMSQHHLDNTTGSYAHM